MEPYEIWTRNSFDVKAARVTEMNIRAVAAWCNGKIYQTEGKKLYISVGVVHYHRFHEIKAHIGDWILESGGVYMHYRDKAFRQAYKNKRLQMAGKRGEILGLVVTAMSDPRSNPYVGTAEGFTQAANQITDRIMKVFEGEG